jgi:hypothetical protein
MEAIEIRQLLLGYSTLTERESEAVGELLNMDDELLESFWGYAWERCRSLSERNKATKNGYGEISSPARWILKCFAKFLYLDWQGWKKLQEETKQKQEEQTQEWNKRKEAKLLAKQKAQAEKYQPLSTSELRRVAADVHKKEVGE